MGLDYVFVKDGNDIDSLITAFKQVKDSTYPVVVHICTQKGKGYKIAEENKENWHYCAHSTLKQVNPICRKTAEKIIRQ